MATKVELIPADGGEGRLDPETKVVTYAYDLVKHDDLGNETLHTFSQRYSSLRALHESLDKGGVFDRLALPLGDGVFASTFPSAYVMRDMTKLDNRRHRSAELRAYLSALLLQSPGIWDEQDVRDELSVDAATASLIAVAIRQVQEAALQRAAALELAEAEERAAAMSMKSVERNLPAHFRGTWVHDDRSDDLKPLLDAMGVGWLGLKVGHEDNPDIEIYFSETHFVVFEDDAEGGTTSQFLLNGEEEESTRVVDGVTEKISTKYWSNGEIVKTWTWLWHPNGKRKRWAIISERKVEGKSVLYAPSFSEHLCFLPLDNSAFPVVTLERFMKRDASTAPRTLPPSLLSKVWRPKRGRRLSANVSPRPAGEVAVSSATVAGESVVGMTQEQVVGVIKKAVEASTPPSGSAGLAATERTSLHEPKPEPEPEPEPEPAAVAQRRSEPALAGGEEDGHARQARQARAAREERREAREARDASALRERQALLEQRRAELREAEAAAAAQAALLEETLAQNQALQEQLDQVTASDTLPSGQQVGGGARGPVGSDRTEELLVQTPRQPLAPLIPPSRAANAARTPRMSGDGKVRRARQPKRTEEHGDLHTPTEWWQPGAEGGAAARLEDLISRAALASGDPSATLSSLILEAKAAQLRARGLPESEIERQLAALTDELQGLSLKALRARAVSAAVEGGAEAIGAMEAAAAERLSADDANGALASLVVENASLMQRFKLSQQPLSGLRCALPFSHHPSSWFAVRVCSGLPDLSIALVQARWRPCC